MGQNATQYKEAQHIGSIVLSVSAYGGSTFTDLGIGKGFAYTEAMTALTGTPDNGEQPEILIGVANQTAEITGTLWTQVWDNIKLLRGDIDVKTVSGTTGVTTYSTGGLSAQTPVIMKAVQTTRRAATADDVTRWVTTPTAETVTFAEGDSVNFLTTFTFYKCNFTSGENIAPPADSDATPIIEYPFTMTAIEDSARTDGDKLFIREESVALPS
ncbi:MAG: hypothetical protein GY928_08235 [Colwellia sp.]|nr:hypothetical protein [Colwellia sp.]